MSRLHRMTEDRTVGMALLVSGVIVFVVQVLPSGLFALLQRTWPLAVVALGVLILLGRRPS